jgi:hypothetical protein
MPDRATVTKRVRGGASRARNAGEVSFERLTQSVEAAQAALKDLRKEVSKGTRDVLKDLDVTLKDARKSVRSVSRTVSKDLAEIQQALGGSKPARPAATAAPTRKTTAAKAATPRKKTATTARKKTTTARARTAPAATPGEPPPPTTTVSTEDEPGVTGADLRPPA